MDHETPVEVSLVESKVGTDEHRLIDPQSLETLSDEEKSLLQTAEARFYAKELIADVQRIPDISALGKADVPEAKNVSDILSNIRSYLEGVAIKDRFDKDHEARRDWRVAKTLDEWSEERMRQFFQEYMGTPLYNNILISSLRNGRGTFDGDTIVEIENQYRDRDFTPTDRDLINDFFADLKSEMVSPEKVALMRTAYENPNQFRVNHLTTVSANIQRLARIYFRSNNMELYPRLRDIGSDLKHLVDQKRSDNKYVDMDYPEKLKVVRTFEESILDVFNLVIPPELKDTEQLALT